jgi:hypothetical protein
MGQFLGKISGFGVFFGANKRKYGKIVFNCLFY